MAIEIVLSITLWAYWSSTDIGLDSSSLSSSMGAIVKSTLRPVSSTSLVLTVEREILPEEPLILNRSILDQFHRLRQTTRNRLVSLYSV